MACECESGQRVLRLHAENLRQQYPVFSEMATAGRWGVAPGGPQVGNDDVVYVTIGGDAPWQTLGELTNFLRTTMSETQAAGLMASWQPGGEAGVAGATQGCSGGCESGTGLSSCGAPISCPRPLVEMSPLDASPLVEVLREKKIETWFQPVFHSGSHELWGHECLMRARDRDGSLIAPWQLLQWAEQERLIFMLDRVCRETHIENAAWALPGDSSVLINFLPTAVYDPGFCLRTTCAAAKRFGLDPVRVVFEVVETERVAEMAHLRRILDYYRKAGFRTALDDVGSGYAGLTMLADLSPDLIKIDRELVRHAADSKTHRIICHALVQIGKQSDQLVLAEGIETEAEYRVMREMGVDLVQGYLFGKPAAEPAFTAAIAPIADSRDRQLHKPSAA